MEIVISRCRSDCCERRSHASEIEPRRSAITDKLGWRPYLQTKACCGACHADVVRYDGLEIVQRPGGCQVKGIERTQLGGRYSGSRSRHALVDAYESDTGEYLRGTPANTRADL